MSGTFFQEAPNVKQRRDPITGDLLTRGEWISWKIQAVIRRWTFLLLFLLGTTICWSTRSDQVLLWWNLAASALAIVVEFIVGKGMTGQARRDSVILREVRAISQRTERQDEQILALLQRVDAVLEGVKTGALPNQPVL